jgi:hypothetical protein
MRGIGVRLQVSSRHTSGGRLIDANEQNVTAIMPIVFEGLIWSRYSCASLLS